MELVVLEPHPTTGRHRFADVLDGRRDLVPSRVVDLTADPLLVDDLDQVAGIIVMGGPQSVLDDEPWLDAVLDLLRRAVAAEVPVLGVCLGAQLLAVAGGGEVTRRDEPRIGYFPLHRTPAGEDDELTAGWPAGAATLLWHGDAVSVLPADAVPLLTLDATDQVVTWRHGSAIATQSHPEVDAAQVAAWIRQGDLEPQLVAAGTDPDALRDEAARRERFTLAVGLSFLGRFVDGPVRRRVTGSTR